MSLQNRLKIKCESVPERELSAGGAGHEPTAVRSPGETEDGAANLVGRGSNELGRDGVDGIVAKEKRRYQLRVKEVIGLYRPSIPTVPHPNSILKIFDDGGVVVYGFSVNGFPKLFAVEGAIGAGALRSFHRLKMLLIKFRVKFAEGGKCSALGLLYAGGLDAVVVGWKTIPGNSRGIVLKIGAAISPSAKRNVYCSSRHRQNEDWQASTALSRSHEVTEVNKVIFITLCFLEL